MRSDHNLPQPGVVDQARLSGEGGDQRDGCPGPPARAMGRSATGIAAGSTWSSRRPAAATAPGGTARSAWQDVALPAEKAARGARGSRARSQTAWARSARAERYWLRLLNAMAHPNRARSQQPQTSTGKLQVLHHPLNHHAQLLEILLTEEGQVGLQELKEAVDHGGDAPKVARPSCAAEIFGEALRPRSGSESPLGRSRARRGERPGRRWRWRTSPDQPADYPGRVVGEVFLRGQILGSGFTKIETTTRSGSALARPG